MRAALLVAVGLAASGCLGEPTNPPCQQASDCPEGWCRCIEGLCFRFDCPAGPTSDPPDGRADADGVSAACLASTPPQAGDGCCPAGLAERNLDADCVVAEGSLTLPGPLGSPLVRAGEHFVALSGTFLTIARADLGAHGTVALGAASSAVSGPVALAGGEVAVAAEQTVLRIDPADPGAGAQPWPDWPESNPASPPVARSDGGALVVDDAGALVTLPPTGSPFLTAGLLPAGRRWALALSAGEERLAAVGDDGRLHVLALPKGTVLFAKALTARGTPAFGPAGDVFAAVTLDGDGGLSGARPGATWVPLVPEPVGPAPTSPVVTTGGEVIVASPPAKRVVAVRYPSEGGEAAWLVEQLGEAVIGAPALDGPLVLVALASQKVVAIDPTRQPAAVAWQWAAPEALAAAPVPLGDGTAVVPTQAGSLIRLRTY